MIFGAFKKIHFVGIGGIGMSGIAEILHNMGFTVTGSDMISNANVKNLLKRNINIEIGHDAKNVVGSDIVVYSSAIPFTNPEIIYAEENHIPIVKRGEMLAELMRMKYSIGVAGSHGKTTTTSMIANMLTTANLDPTVIVGGILNRENQNYTYGQSNIMLAETDESDKSFLFLHPSIAIITNIDFEHMEMYEDMDDVKKCFARYANRVPFYGRAILCIDDLNVSDIIPIINKRIMTYGLSAQSDVRGANIVKDGFSSSFDVFHEERHLGNVEMHIPGTHNILNALATIACGIEMEVPFDKIVESMKNYNGIQRRMTVRYESDSVIVLDDYAHHPTELDKTLQTLREACSDKKIIAVFQPHRYSRVKDLMKEFGKCFYNASYLFVTDVYAAGEKPIDGISGKEIVNRLIKHGQKNVKFLNKWDDIYTELENIGVDNTVIVTFGAGNITNLSFQIADFIRGDE